MTTAMTSVDILNRLLVIHSRSLAMYLRDACPWARPQDSAAQDVLNSIIASNTEFADRFGEMVIADGGAAAHGEFPMQFTALHDCALSYLIGMVRDAQANDIRLISDCVDKLDDDPLAKALAQESLGAARAHLDALDEVV
jgi:hypothetical protein